MSAILCKISPQTRLECRRSCVFNCIKKDMFAKLDLFRALLLKETLRFSFLNRLFHLRSLRVLLLFLSAAAFYFVASSFFPLWVLLLGPILWGIPHLVSSLRYSSLPFNEKSRKKLLQFQFGMWALVFCYRMAADVFLQPVFLKEYPLLFEALCLLASFLFQVNLYRKLSLKMLISSLGFSTLLAATFFYPIQTALMALIGHNYLPLIAWYKSCQDRADRNVFVFSALIYLSLSLVIYFGGTDFLYTFYNPAGTIAFLNWDYSEVILPFVSGEMDYQFWFHIVVLYAFSQAMHYFIWMKAIPENYQKQQHPPSFQWSFNRLANDFGSASVIVFLILGCLVVLSWFLLEFQTARLVYFSIASYHGFMELSALPFLTSNRKD